MWETVVEVSQISSILVATVCWRRKEIGSGPTIPPAPSPREILQIQERYLATMARLLQHQQYGVPVTNITRSERLGTFMGPKGRSRPRMRFCWTFPTPT